jgi:NADH-quinone oxidoreductase subunit L
MNPIELLWLIPFLPFAGAVANGVVLGWGGRRAPRALVNAVALGTPAASLAVALACLWQYRGLWPQTVETVSYAWTTGAVGGGGVGGAGAGGITINVAFLLDPLAAVMLFVVTFVGFLIHLYSVGYMAHEEGYQRYFAYLNLFMAAMLTLILGNNFLVSFVGWEGVGLCSYLLIGYYYDQDFPPYAGKKAFIVNRVGDFAFLVGMFALVARLGTLDYGRVLPRLAAEPALGHAPYAMGLSFAAFVGLCLFIGAMGKSAQFPLYVWLPDAMAGPTPVSALIHAATMVTAGVYMTVRANVLFQLAPEIATFVASIGAFTAIFAASIGLAQNDIKKVLAYSTVSQLGYMFLAVGVGAYTAAIFHLMTHAFFKALLFLGSGSVIHAMGGEQDMLKMGGLSKKLPVTYRTFLIGALAISGIPPLAGFFSKDAILAGSAAEGQWFFWTVGWITAGITAFYMFRAVYLTFHGEFRGTPEQEHHLHESPPVMTGPLVVLALGAVVAGWVGIPKVLALGADVNWIEHFLAPVRARLQGPEPVEHDLGLAADLVLIALSVAIGLGGILLARSLYRRGPQADRAWAERFPGLYRLLAHKYYVDELYDAVIVRPLAALSRFCWKVIDSIVIDGSIRGGAFLAELAGDIGKFTTTGNVRNYALYFFLGVILLFWWLVR